MSHNDSCKVKKSIAVIPQSITVSSIAIHQFGFEPWANQISSENIVLSFIEIDYKNTLFSPRVLFMT